MTGNHVEKGSFSSTIWADDGAELSFLDLKADPCNGNETIEGFHEVIHLQNHLDGLHLLI